MPFRFAMQKVLDYREQLEEEAKVRLAEAERRLQEAQKRLDQLRGELERAADRLRDNPLMEAGERWLQEQYITGLRADVAAASLQERMMDQMAQEARKLLAARAIDKKLLEKLKERQKKHFIRAEQLQEQRFNDETATLRYKAPAF
ncbi:flagellar export protein FliJ [Desulfovibrio sp. ZJ369]|uniref:flagellar export protein FliJ n=1 Tax=Desulfovibrio sp. ZJ369 TaxID=2709793 RepID=UPI0013EBCFB3|nr:flagellar export protein FliJ [Desulfovibrio sp. ZJ369]